MNVGETAVTAEDVAASLRCSVAKVYRMARTRQIPAFKVGRVWRFYLSDVHDHLNKPMPAWTQSNRSLGRRRAA